MGTVLALIRNAGDRLGAALERTFDVEDHEPEPERKNPPRRPTVEIDPTDVAGGSLTIPAVGDELASIRDRAAFYRKRQENYLRIETHAREMAAQCGRIADNHERSISDLQRYVSTLPATSNA